MERLITDLRALVKAEGRGLALERREPVDLVAIVREALGRAQAHGTRHLMRVEVPQFSIVGSCDRDRRAVALHQGDQAKVKVRAAEPVFKARVMADVWRSVALSRN